MPRVSLVLAHGAEGLTGDGVPAGVLYGAVLVGVVLGVVGLRARGTSSAAPTVAAASIDGTEVGPWPGDELPAAARVAGQSLGLAALVLALVVGWGGSPLSGLNPLPLAMIAVVWWAVPALALLLGDWWRVIDPYDALAAGIDRMRGRTSDAPTTTGADDEADDWWVPAVLLASFAWLTTGWIDGQDPRPLVAWLTALTALMVGGALVAGRPWVRRSSPMAVLCGVVAGGSPVRWDGGRVGLRSPRLGLAARAGGRRTLAVVVTLIGATLWEVVAGSAWWADLAGGAATSATPWWALFGLAATIGAVALAWWALARLGEIAALARGATLGEPLAGDLAVALAGCAAVAPIVHQLSTFLVYVQDLVAMSSDPFGRGANVFGTARWRADETLISAATANWIQLGLLGAALALLMVGGWDRLVARFDRVALDVVWSVGAAAVLVGVVYLRYLLGA